jgi:hypothetical protein
VVVLLLVVLLLLLLVLLLLLLLQQQAPLPKNCCLISFAACAQQHLLALGCWCLLRSAACGADSRCLQSLAAQVLPCPYHHHPCDNDLAHLHRCDRCLHQNARRWLLQLQLLPLAVMLHLLPYDAATSSLLAEI